MRAGATQRVLESVATSEAENIVVVAHSQDYAFKLRRRLADMVTIRRMTKDSIETRDGRRILFRSADNWEEALAGLHPTPEVFHDHHWVAG